MAKSRAQYIQEHSDGSNDISFDLVDEATVKRLQKDKKIKVPKKKVDIPKDKRWNEKQMASKILQGIQNGDSIPKMSKAMTEVIGNNLTSAIRNTRTMTTSAECNGRLDSYKKLADQGVVQKKVWMATPDDRTRPTHIDLDGEEQDIDKAFSNGCQFPGDGNGPAEEVWQCFTGETSMATDSEVVRSYKHWYDGDLIKVKTVSGVYFACTPNHPILSEFGWVRANGLNNGDNLLVTFVRDNSFFVSRRNPNIKHIFSRMDTFHKTLDVVFGKRRSNLTVNFHGDIATTNVEVVSQKRLLGICNNSCIIKSLYKLLFKLTYSFLSCKGNFVKCFFGLKFSTNSGMSGTRELFSIIDRCLRHSKIHSTRPVTRGDSVLLKTMIDNSTTDTEFFCESLDGLSRVVFLDKIIDIQIDTFHGYVYNLQTDNNYYFVNNIISQKQEKNNCIYAIAHNCRCTMTDHIIGFKRADGSISYVDYNRDKTLHDEQMEEEKEKRTSKDTSTHTVVDGKDISTTWGRRADKFDFEIEDVINAQGFDGLPRVVSADEFDRYVQEANNGNGFIAQRTYSAPNQETLDAYRDQLYNGKWYVDCSTGGAQYGQGMYCAADYTGKITDGMRNEMVHYQKLGQTRATKIVDNEQINKAVEVQWGRIKSDISFPYDNDGKILHNEAEVKEELRKAIGNLYGGEIEKLYGVTGNNKFAIENKFSYTETLTLDSSARIISHDDLIKLREESKSVLINEELEKVYTGDDLYMAKRVAGSMNDSERNRWSDFRSNNRDKWLEFEEKNESAIGTITDSAQIKYDKLRNMDIGSYATLKGYDAINAEGHGASGSYTVILNRTKVIFKRE